MQSKDSVTGLYWEVRGIGTIENDQYYDRRSAIINKLRSKGSSITGIEFEMSKDTLIVNRIYGGRGGDTQYDRGAYRGKFKFSNGELSEATIKSFALYKTEVIGGSPKYQSVEITNFPSPRVVKDINKPFDDAVSNDGIPRALEAFKLDGVITGNFNGIFSFGGGKIFTPNWWFNPVDTNLI